MAVAVAVGLENLGIIICLSFRLMASCLDFVQSNL